MAWSTKTAVTLLNQTSTYISDFVSKREEHIDVFLNGKSSFSTEQKK